MNYEQNSLDQFPSWDYEPKLRRCLLDICEDNPCEAMLLDFFYAETLISHQLADEVEEVEVKENRLSSKGSGYLLASLMFRFFGYLFTEDQIYEAIFSLAKKEWVDFQLESGELGKGIVFYAHLGKIQDAIKEFRATQRITKSYDYPQYYYHANRDEALANEIRAEEKEIIESRLAGQEKTEEEVRCHRKETKRIASHLYRDKVRGVSGTLTLTQWLKTLDHFNWKCAYCQGPYEVLEHFLPVFLNGKTTWDNCVPACISCNSKKKDTHPSNLKAKMGDCIEQIQIYLSQARFEHGESGAR